MWVISRVCRCCQIKTVTLFFFFQIEFRRRLFRICVFRVHIWLLHVLKTCIFCHKFNFSMKHACNSWKFFAQQFFKQFSKWFFKQFFMHFFKVFFVIEHTFFRRLVWRRDVRFLWLIRKCLWKSLLKLKLLLQKRQTNDESMIDNVNTMIDVNIIIDVNIMIDVNIITVLNFFACFVRMWSWNLMLLKNLTKQRLHVIFLISINFSLCCFNHSQFDEHCKCTSYESSFFVHWLKVFWHVLHRILSLKSSILQCSNSASINCWNDECLWNQIRNSKKTRRFWKIFSSIMILNKHKRKKRRLLQIKNSNDDVFTWCFDLMCCLKSDILMILMTINENAEKPQFACDFDDQC